MQSEGFKSSFLWKQELTRIFYLTLQAHNVNLKGSFDRYNHLEFAILC